MGLISCLLSREETDDNEEYEVCDRHGHDYREFEAEKIDSKFQRYYRSHRIIEGIRTSVLPGRMIGLQYLYQKKVAPCRDCPAEKIKNETIERRIIIREDGEIRSLTQDNYEEMVEKSTGSIILG